MSRKDMLLKAQWRESLRVGLVGFFESEMILWIDKFSYLKTKKFHLFVHLQEIGLSVQNVSSEP